MKMINPIAGDAQVSQSAPVRWARLKRVTSALSEAITTREVAAAMVQQGFGALGATRGFVGLLSEDRATLELVVMAGYEDETATAWPRIPMSLSLPITDAIRMTAAIFLG